ncbi:MAG: type IV pilin N-terminal domain-containing protein [Methanoregula sp.]|nr:type IV pilin N-terminal domain-containing protein [Methanoregula sp.]
MRPGRNHADAVSPVVGVILMLAVTVMIAAIVSTYAGGFSGGAEKSPQSSIQATPNLDDHCIYFEHNGGDPFMINSIKIFLRAGDNTTSLSAHDTGSSKVLNFTEVGNSGGGSNTTIKTGDTFFITGRDFGSGTGIQFGSMVLMNNTPITWLIVDRETGKTISMGKFYL